MSARGAARGGATRADGVLVVDKARGPTSHDVVARARRLLGTSRVGHAGTLDPMATGVLVVLVGEATKLSPYLTAHDKRYRATISLGAGTDTLDAEGSVTSRADVPPELCEELERLAEAKGSVDDTLAAAAPRLAAALAAERARTEQVPPAYSAIQTDGRRSHERARKGEAVELPPRPVGVTELHLCGVRAGVAPELDLELTVLKGYYVRSFARDLGERLGVPSHLSSLRRLASGPFRVEESVSLDAEPELLAARLVPPTAAALRCLPACHLTEEGARRARQGAAVRSDHVVGDFPVAPLVACIGPDGRLVTLSRPESDRLVVERGFSDAENDT